MLRELALDESEWAKAVCERVLSKDQFALAATFELIRRAKSMSWVECLEMEYTVAHRILSMSTLKLR